METHLFAVTPWRTSEELLELRRWFYDREGVIDRRRQAVDKVLAWRVRKPDLPLLLDSTADIVDAVLQDESGGLEHNALRLVYAAAIQRFVTGFSDTQLDLRRSRPTWLSQTQSQVSAPSPPFLDFPVSLLETRHNIVHRQLPPLFVLKRAAQQSLQWLWEWYWSHLDAALSHSHAPKDTDVSDNIDVLKEKLQSVLKSYVRARKTELKTRKSKALTSSTAAESALSALSLHTSLSNAKTRNAVLALLVGDRQILPATRKLGDNMSGAFLIWSPLLVRMSGASKGFLAALVEALGGVFSTQCDDAAKEAMYEWVVHVLTSADFTQSRKEAEGDVVQQTLETCFTHVTSWHLRVAEALLKEDGIPDRKLWETLLDAAKNESMGKQSDNGAEGSREAKEAERDHDAMEVETEHVTMEPRTKAHTIVKEKQCGPSKYVGMWKPRPIGALPIGWEVDTL